MHPALRLLAPLAALILTGCTSNPLLSFKHPAQIAPAAPPVPASAAFAPAAPHAAPLVIEVNDSGYPLDYLIARAGLAETYVAHFAGNRHLEKHHRRQIEVAPLRALWWSANVNLYKTELAAALRAAFPGALVYVRSVPYAERFAFARSFPPPLDHRHAFADLPPHPVADLVVTVDNQQGTDGEEANYRGSTFGRSLFVNFHVHPAGTVVPAFSTRTPAGAASTHYAKVAANYATAPTAEELASVRAKIASAHWSIRSEWGRLDLARGFFTDYPGDEAYRAAMESHLARYARVMSSTFMGIPRARTDLAALENWTADPATSPLAPFYRWTLFGVGEVAPLAAAPAAHAARLDAWAAFYEPDPALRAAFAAHAAGTPGAPAADALPPKVRALLRLHDAETTFVRRHGEVLAEAPARGELGAFARQAALEQEGLRKGFENRLLATNLLGFAGAGVGAGLAGGAANLAVQGATQATLVAARAMLVDTVEDAREGAAEMSAALATEIGAITLDLDGQSIAVTAPDYASFRAQTLALYKKL